VTRLLHQSEAEVELAMIDLKMIVKRAKKGLYHCELNISLALMQKLGYLSRT
jgi:hypothetical protein